MVSSMGITIRATMGVTIPMVVMGDALHESTQVLDQTTVIRIEVGDRAFP